MELAALERRRDELRERLSRARAADPRIARAPEGDVLVGMPVAFAAELVRQATRGLLGEVEITLRNLKVHKVGSVKAKTRLGTIQPGRYTLDLTIHEARVLLEPGMPEVDFRGGRVGIALPVTAARGQGHGTLKFGWDSQGLGRLACDDFQVTLRVAARAVPRTYPVKGAFDLSVEDGALVATPDFPDVAARVGFEPSEQTWRAFERVIEKRSWRCRALVKKLDLRELLGDLFERGFVVRVPPRIFRRARLRAAVQQSLTFSGRTYAVGARLLDVRLTPDILWYGAAIDVRTAEPSPTPAPADTVTGSAGAGPAGHAGG
jgi:hypothetical protein